MVEGWTFPWSEKQLKQKAGNATAEGKSEFPSKFENAMDDDLNVSAAWAAVFEWVRDTNRQLAEDSLSPSQAAAQLQAWDRVDSVLGIGQEDPSEDTPEEILQLAEQRQQARQCKDWAEADRLRDALKSKGWVIEDTPNGPRPKRI